MSRFVPGEGPQPCPYMLVGEGPGVEEDKAGRPFVGKSGRELWRYLWRACCLSRNDVWTTNLVKYRVPDDGDPTPEDIARDAPLLKEELRNVHPEVIVTLGRWSSRRFLGPVDMDWCHGLPHLVKGVVVMPVVHPAAGLHSTEFQGTIAWDFEQLGKLLRGEDVRWAVQDEYPEPEYTEIKRPRDEGRSGTDGLVAVDTEGSAAKPWCLSYAPQPGLALCDRQAYSKFEHIILHNAMHDIGVLRAQGVEYDRFDDTMIQAYLLCVEPQGLKALAKRYCGMEMSSYEELVSGPNRKHALKWLAGVLMWLDKRSPSVSKESGPTAKRKTARRLTSGRGGRRSARTSRMKQRS